MILLLDTHTFLWMATGSPRLPERAKSAISDPVNRGLLSAASAWELATKYRLGRLDEANSVLPSYATVRDLLELEELPISTTHALLAGSLDGEHGDPFDRIIAAQALVEGAVVITKDPAFERFGVVTLW
jgi:PIN domain nuclease of toxin-antitoxin system